MAKEMNIPEKIISEKIDVIWQNVKNELADDIFTWITELTRYELKKQIK